MNFNNRALLEVVTPGRIVFLGSLILSVIAVQQSIINRDGILYVETARAFLDQGWSAAQQKFNWPLLPVLMALLAKVTGLETETAGQVLNALFMAGCCTLLLSSSARIFPSAVWPTCLVILSLPAFNGYRNELLREYGAWFFIMLSFWLALRWIDKPDWRAALWVQLALLVAALFRPEALSLFVALWGWQFFSVPKELRWQRMFMLATLPLLGLVALLVLTVTGGTLPSRLLGDMSRFRLTGFDAKAAALAPSLIEYARGNAGTILFFGSLAIVPLKFFGKLGLFAVPLAYAFATEKTSTLLGRSALFAWGLLTYSLVLCVFVLDLQFLAGRYIALLLVFTTPITGYGLHRLIERFPRWKYPTVAICLALMAANVISTGPGKQHYVEAGEWLAKNAADLERVYIDEPRVAYYAGKRFSGRGGQPFEPERMEKEMAEHRYDLIVLSLSSKNRDIEEWLRRNQLEQVQRFTNKAGDAIVVAVPAAIPSNH